MKLDLDRIDFARARIAAAGGPPPQMAHDYARAERILDGLAAGDDLAAVPVLVWWALGTIAATGVAVGAFSVGRNLVDVTNQVTTVALWGALAFGAYLLARRFR